MSQEKEHQKQPSKIGAGVRTWIFWGAPMCFFMPFVYVYEPLARAVGEKIAPIAVVLYGALILIVTMVVDDFIPKKLLIPVGTLGWLLTFIFLYWYFCFGPGAFGHQP